MVNLHIVGSLFTLFSGEEDVKRYMPLLSSAMEEINARLRIDVNTADMRLYYLAAAVANLRYTQITAARDKALATYAGTIARQSDASQQLRFAENLVSTYEGLCSELLKDKKQFFFWGVGRSFDANDCGEGDGDVEEGWYQ